LLLLFLAFFRSELVLTNLCPISVHTEPFPVFSLQKMCSHLNICYYQQDLRRGLFRPPSRATFLTDRPRALLLERASFEKEKKKEEGFPSRFFRFFDLLIARPSVGRMLERHPFSGQIHSAGELLHPPYADFYFHDHRPAVSMSRRLLWFLE